MSDRRDRLSEELCERRTQFVVVFSFGVLFLLLQVPYLAVTEPDSTLFAVATLNALGSSFFVVFGGSVLWLCRRRA